MDRQKDQLLNDMGDEIARLNSSQNVTNLEKKDKEEKEKKERKEPRTVKLIAPPPKESSSSSATYKKVYEDEKKDKDEKERLALIGKINNYFRDPRLSCKLSPELKPPGEKMSLADARALFAKIQADLFFEAKQQFVDGAFFSVCMGTETLLTSYLKQPEKQGLARKCLIPLKDEYFGQELAEISAEVPNDFIPDAKLRLLCKLLFVVQNYDISKVPVSNTQPAQEAPTTPDQ